MNILELDSFLTSDYPLADYCPSNYEQGRAAFLESAKRNPFFRYTDSLPITAKGPNQSDLFIDIAVIGNLTDAKKILIHISGTHGVEGGAGSGIQNELLSNSFSLVDDTAIIFIHALNPFGMAWNRRVNEKNIDLNRNFTRDRKTPELYATLDPVFNPTEIREFNQSAFDLLVHEHGWPAIKKILAEGQYSFPQGLFYGGEEIAEGPQLVLDWFKRTFLGRELTNLYFGILDVHTGLGPYGVDTLFTPTVPSEIMLKLFGEKMSLSAQMATIGYKPTGMFVQGLSKKICKITKCAEDRIFIIGQEFGTVAEAQVMLALYEENNIFHHDEKTYDPNGEAGRKMLNAFYPTERRWRHLVVQEGRVLVEKSLHILETMV